MLKSYVEAVCWLARHDDAVLVVSEYFARVVDTHARADGVHMKAAQALLAPRRVIWFDVKVEGSRRRMRLNAAGETYHRRLAAARQCACPRTQAGANGGGEKEEAEGKLSPVNRGARRRERLVTYRPVESVPSARGAF